MSSRTVTQRELYQLVWKRPMTKVAAYFGLSDVGLAKTCRRYDIPIPSRGYWAKRENGHATEPTPLPAAEYDCHISIRDPQTLGFPSLEMRQIAAKSAAATGSENLKIGIADGTDYQHRLVIKSEIELRRVKEDKNGYLVRSKKLPLDIKVSRKAAPRALAILDAVLTALAKQGYPIDSGPTVTIFDVPISFRIEEQLEPSELSQEENNRSERSRQSSRGRTSRLSLRIEDSGMSWLAGCRRTWSDTQKQPLELKLGKFVQGLVQIAARHRQHDDDNRRELEALQKEERRRQAESRRTALKRQSYLDEKDRLAELLSQAAQWQQANLIRSFVREVEAVHSQIEPIESGSDIASWIEWSLQQADRLDPIRPGAPSILDEIHLEDEPMDCYRDW